MTSGSIAYHKCVYDRCSLMYLKALEGHCSMRSCHNTVHTDESGLLAQIPWEWQAKQEFSSRQLSILSAAFRGSKC